MVEESNHDVWPISPTASVCTLMICSAADTPWVGPATTFSFTEDFTETSSDLFDRKASRMWAGDRAPEKSDISDWGRIAKQSFCEFKQIAQPLPEPAARTVRLQLAAKSSP